MDRKAYIQAVLSALHHVTGDERAAIQAELDGHIEDHMEGLLELGYSPELAEERTLDAMGDPKEVGRELNKQYTGWGFVLLSRAAVLLTVVLCIQALLGLGILGNLLDSVWARVAPLEPEEISAAVTQRLRYPGADRQRRCAGLWGLPVDPGGCAGSGGVCVRL